MDTQINLSWHNGEIIAVSITAPGADFRALSLSTLDDVADEILRDLKSRGYNPPRFYSTPIPCKGEPSTLILAD